MPGTAYSDDYVSNLEWTKENHTVRGEALIVGIDGGRFRGADRLPAAPGRPRGRGLSAAAR